MKNIKFLLILFCLPIISLGQIKIKDLPTTDSGSVNDFILKDDSAGVSGSTKKISVADFISTYLPGSATSSGSSSPLFFARAATTASLSATYSSNTLTATSNGRFGLQDVVFLSLGDYLLVKNQTNNKLQNGLYSLYDTGTVSTTAKLVRVEGYNETGEIYPSQISVTEGNINAGRYYLQTTVDPIVGTDQIVFVSTPAPPNPVYPVAFVDVFTVTDLPNSPAYTSGTNINNPGLNAIYTATTSGAFPSLQGVTPQNGTKILVRAQTDSTKNGDYVFLNVGSASSKWKIKRINYTASQLYPKLWEVSQGTYKGLVFQQNNKSLVNSTIGTSGNIYFTNITPAADQTVAITAGTNTGVSGTYPTFTISATNIFTTDGTLTEDRVLTGASNDLTFTGIDYFTLSGNQLDCGLSQQNFTGTSHLINTIGFTRKGTNALFGTVNQLNQDNSGVQLYSLRNNGQGIYGTGDPEVSAKLELKDVTKGFLPNRWTTTERDAISSPVNGLMGYNTTTHAFNGYQNGVWASIGSNFFTQGSGFVRLTSTTDGLQVGTSTVSIGASFGIRGQGATSGTSNLKGLNTSDAVLFDVKDNGDFWIGGTGLTTPNGVGNLNIKGTSLSAHESITGWLNNAASSSSWEYKIGDDAIGATRFAVKGSFLGLYAGGDTYNAAGAAIVTSAGNLNIYKTGTLHTQFCGAALSYINNGVGLVVGYDATLAAMLGVKGAGSDGTTNAMSIYNSSTTLLMKVKNNGVINIPPISATAASALTPAEGDIVIVNTTNGTFLVEGLYSYSNGAWRK